MSVARTFLHWRWSVPSLLGVGLLAWWLLRPSSLPRDVPPLIATEAVVAPPPPPPIATATASPEGGLIRPAGSAELDARGMQPHPITAQHQRIFRENELIGSLNGAMDVKDPAGLRRLLRQYRDEYPEDAHVLAEGYELIADCLERPGSQTRAAARRYYDERLDSGLRRYVRRYCLEGN